MLTNAAKPVHHARFMGQVTLAVFLLTASVANCFAEDKLAQATVITPPDGGRDVLSFGPSQTVEFESQNVVAAAKWIDTKGLPFAKAYGIDSDTRFTDPDNMRLHIPINGSVRKGDVVLISFWIRRPGAGGQPNNAYLFVDAKPGVTSYQYSLSAYREWTQHVRSFVATDDFDSSDSCLRIQLGEAGEVVQIADLRLVNYGAGYDIATLPRSTIMYEGRNKDAAWRKKALVRIEEIRKGDIAITVVDAGGRPVPNATVHVAMQQHAFGFGNAVNSEVLGAVESDFPINPKKKISVSWVEAQKYRQIVKKYFDRVTFESEFRPHNWKMLQSNTESWRRKNRIFVENTIPWLLDNNIAVRGHYIGWAPMDFNSVEKEFVGNPDGHRAWLWEHMADVLPATADYVTEWDTINHIIGWGSHTYEKEYGGPQIYAEIMAEARRLAPQASHAINEGKVLPDGYKREPYKEIIRFLNDNGQAPDIVGFMGHFGLTSLTPPEELLKVYDEFAEIAPRLQLSEFDVEAGDDEELQADYYRDVMIASFSHPNFVAIIQWGFWEKMHWKPAAALWREDWTLKPSGQAFVDLVASQWWTDETSETDIAGKCRVRGFFGEYEITAEKDGASKMVHVTATSDGTVVQIQIP
ncbi:endo-1,4-beta-xylanase [Rubripirellula reticaptiva]|nr:endo-1,4-beta-xylanase [Rubripirellula reticaptiva]